MELPQAQGLIKVNNKSISSNVCVACQLGKSKCLPFELFINRSVEPSDLIHCVHWGPVPVMFRAHHRYYVSFVDDCTRFIWYYPLVNKADFFSVYLLFEKFVFTQFEKKIKCFHSDGGGEFKSEKLRRHLQEKGTLHKFTCPYTPQQAGVVERKHRSIVETELTQLLHSKVSLIHWNESFQSAVYLLNRLPSKALVDNKSPYKLLFGRTPEYKALRVFECSYFPCLGHYPQHKFSPRSVWCIFLGYSTMSKGYKCLDLKTGRIYMSRRDFL